MKKIFSIAFFVLILGLPASSQAATYNLDADHTTINFKVHHLISWVNGQFKQFEGTFDYEPGKPETWKAKATIQAASIDTGVAPRDKHLRSPEFFDVDQFPTLTFESTKATAVDDKHAKLEGNLTIHGVTKPVVLDVEILGEVKDPWGNQLAGFTATTTINRKDFGLTWNKTVETGQLLVGEDVQITIEVSGMKAGAEQAPAAS
ncbi:MAG TPA: YceI family protein [Verrucomicrobiae bacterium]|jgi:polyisoprenoid-binding protein YceI|nr:YceI family protein [Verrucomicrobiae bacterium]